MSLSISIATNHRFVDALTYHNLPRDKWGDLDSGESFMNVDEYPFPRSLDSMDSEGNEFLLFNRRTDTSIDIPNEVYGVYRSFMFTAYVKWSQNTEHPISLDILACDRTESHLYSSTRYVNEVTVPYEDSYYGKIPFYDLFNFADHYGILGTGACERLKSDFQFAAEHKNHVGEVINDFMKMDKDDMPEFWASYFNDKFLASFISLVGMAVNDRDLIVYE